MRLDRVELSIYKWIAAVAYGSLAMTLFFSLQGIVLRHCEERSDEAILISLSSSNEQKSMGSSSREIRSGSQNTKKCYASMTADRKPNDELLQKAKVKAEVEENSENAQDKLEENPSPKNSKN